MKVVIALGANLGNPRKQISLAIDAIRDIVNVEKVSSLYETAPFKVSDEQPNYINAVLLGDTELQPKELIKELLSIESKLGRQRSIPKAARTIDIDIIDYEGFFLESEELTERNESPHGPQSPMRVCSHHGSASCWPSITYCQSP